MIKDPTVQKCHHPHSGKQATVQTNRVSKQYSLLALSLPQRWKCVCLCVKEDACKFSQSDWPCRWRLFFLHLLPGNALAVQMWLYSPSEIDYLKRLSARWWSIKSSRTGPTMARDESPTGRSRGLRIGFLIICLLAGPLYQNLFESFIILGFLIISWCLIILYFGCIFIPLSGSLQSSDNRKWGECLLRVQGLNPPGHTPMMHNPNKELCQITTNYVLLQPRCTVCTKEIGKLVAGYIQREQSGPDRSTRGRGDNNELWLPTELLFFKFKKKGLSLHFLFDNLNKHNFCRLITWP